MKSPWLLLIGVFAGIAAGGVLAKHYVLTRTPVTAPIVREPITPPAALADLQESFHRVVEQIKPSVVHITVQIPTMMGPASGLGSGIIIGQDGAIVTNYHVVRGANKIAVSLVDGRTFPARVIGTVEGADVAVIKINPPPDIVPAVLGDSDATRVGDIVLAVGSPFGFKYTVSQGIVSAKERALGDGYEDFIQTDASINKGNSGGPLVNLKGEVIGMNTMIVSDTGQSFVGLGFARSINLVKMVMELIVTDKKPGYLGITRTFPLDDVRLVLQLRQEFNMHVSSLDDVMRELGLKELKGVPVREVFRNSPAEKAGLKPLDVIVEYNGKKVATFEQLWLLIQTTPPGSEIAINIIRGGRAQTVKTIVTERPRNQ